jgi:DNA repair protein SbcC/Rad50
MRPIMLDLNGFASFREPTRVDFADADFFALVGPTGSGKSTVIDAMTFALYGSVPRWGRKNMVSLALAPTAARGTVKLVFDVAGERYVVARELRRMGSQVNQKSASLERLADPRGLAASGEPTLPLAKDLAGVNEAIERLLGLSYEDFIQCVVLPQGQFADFLQAKPGERQEILLRLLGAEHYKQMMVQANQRAGAAAQRSAAITETLRGYADATPEAEAAARESARALDRLGMRVAAALPRITESQAELKAAEERLGRLRTEHAALTALRVPDGAATLDADLAASGAALDGLRGAEQAAEAADTAARAALADGPRRAPLELARERRAERGRYQAARPGLTADVTRLGAGSAEAAAAVETASAALDEARTRRDETSRAAEAAAGRVAGLTAEHSRLSAVAVPGGTAELDQRRGAAADAVTAAAGALDQAERDDAAARAARAAAPPEAPLAQASRDLGDLRTLLGGLAHAQDAARRAAAARQAAEDTLTAAEETRRERHADLEEARRAHVAAGLRPHLVAGEPCPVCEQPVTTLPAPLPAGEVDAAQARLTEAERAVTSARSAARTADTAAAKADADLAAAAARRTALAGDLADLLSGPLTSVPLPAVRAAATAHAAGTVHAADTAHATDTAHAGTSAPPAGDPDELLAGALAEVAALARARTQAEQAADRAAQTAQRARAGHRSAQAAAERAEAELTSARAALRAARDPLVELGAPLVDDVNLAAGWAALAQWAGGQAQARAAALSEARQAAAAAEGQRQAAVAGFGDAEGSLARLRAAAKTASDSDQQARARLSQLTARVAELDALLAGAPDDAQVTARLALLAGLEAAAADAERTLRDARAARARGESAHAELERAAGSARARLSAARDRVVALGAPALDGRGLLDGWTDLVGWASGQAAARQTEIDEADAATAAARASAGKLAGELSADLAAAGITLAPDAAAAGAGSAVATAAERARAAIGRIEERRGEAAALAGRQRAAAAEEQVAKLLGDLLRANQFQRWLVTEALDDLVAEASATLAALSSGQFDLVYDDGDFYVVDHGDADSRRSVRTLSGGETFQASLALALALSTQISSLAAAGAARLDSIFLDEGFGTLDPETLEVVATTLEALAEGDRMVGVVTHVAALAERVPVRFRVARNARTSTVTREGLLAETEES